MDNNHIIEKLQEKLKEFIQKNKELSVENENIKQILIDNDLDLADARTMSIEEKICVEGITHLQPLFTSGNYTKDDVSSFDILYKNLRLIRGLEVKPASKKTSPLQVSEMLKIIKGSANG